MTNRPRSGCAAAVSTAFRQLKSAVDAQGSDELSSSLGAARKTVRRALASSGSGMVLRMVLASLDEQLRRMDDVPPEQIPALIEVCVEGARLLVADHSRSEVSAWLQRANIQGRTGFVWLTDDSLLEED